jgi:hypothetical protein
MNICFFIQDIVEYRLNTAASGLFYLAHSFAEHCYIVISFPPPIFFLVDYFFTGISTTVSVSISSMMLEANSAGKPSIDAKIALKKMLAHKQREARFQMHETKSKKERKKERKNESRAPVRVVIRHEDLQVLHGGLLVLSHDVLLNARAEANLHQRLAMSTQRNESENGIIKSNKPRSKRVK